MDKRRRKRKKRIKISCFDAFCLLVIVVNVVVAALFIVRPILENSVVMAELSPNCDVYRVYLYGNHEINKISEKEFESMHYEERIKFLKNVIVDAGSKLGLSGEICIIVRDLQKENPPKGERVSLSIKGYYSSFSNAIFLDKNHVKSASLEECVNTVLHELNHYYFYKVCSCLKKLDPNEKKLEYFGLANELNENFKNYIDTENLQIYDYYHSYLNQPLEIEARQFAEQYSSSYIKVQEEN